jgi:hypothetical protein
MKFHVLNNYIITINGLSNEIYIYSFVKNVKFPTVNFIIIKLVIHSLHHNLIYNNNKKKDRIQLVIYLLIKIIIIINKKYVFNILV